MNEMKLIEDFCAEEAQPGPERLTRSRARLLAAIDGSQLSGPEPLSRRPWATHRLCLALTATAAGAAGGLVIVSLVAGGRSVTPGDRQVPAGLLAGQPARAFLLAMAAKATQQQGGRFYCTTEIQGNRELVGSGDRLLPQPWAAGPAPVPTSAPQGFKYALTRRYRITQCTRVADVTRYALSMQYLGARPASPADARAWRHDGSPDHWRQGHGVLSAHPGPVTGVHAAKHGTGDFGGRNDLWLPTDPAKLRAVFLAHPQPGAQGRENVIAAGALTVMNSDNVRPAVRAAAFRVLADVPDVRMKPGVTDPEGQNRHRHLARLLDRLRSPLRNQLRHHRPANRQHPGRRHHRPDTSRRCAARRRAVLQRNHQRLLDQPAPPAYLTSGSSRL